MAYCAKLSARFASFRSRYMSGSNPFTSHAKWTGNVDESNLVIGAPPDTPAVIARQVAATSLPTGVIAPIPVTTTRRFILRSSLRRGAPPLGIPPSGSRGSSLRRGAGALRLAPHLRVQVTDCVTDGAE